MTDNQEQVLVDVPALVRSLCGFLARCLRSFWEWQQPYVSLREEWTALSSRVATEAPPVLTSTDGTHCESKEEAHA